MIWNPGKGRVGLRTEGGRVGLGTREVGGVHIILFKPPQKRETKNNKLV